jgi:hypothetical protein
METLIQLTQNVLSRRDPNLSNETKRIILKEFLQAYALDFLYNHPKYRKLNFYGGTCLHIIFGLNRLSEDIDLDNSQGIDLQHFEGDVANYFQRQFGYTDLASRTQEGEWGIRRTNLKFPILYSLGLTSHSNELLNLRIDVSQHKQVSILQKTPLLAYGRSFVAGHFSLETMMAGKMLACLERNFQKGRNPALVKGRDFYDLLWFMQRKIHPLGEKLAKDGKEKYTVHSAFLALKAKVDTMKKPDLSHDLLPLFEQRSFIEAWLENFQANFSEYSKSYL